VQINRKEAFGHILSERLAKYVKYIAFKNFFPRTHLMRRPNGGFWRTVAQIMQNHARMCLFCGMHDGRPYLWGQIRQNPQKWASLGNLRLFRRKIKMV